ncbi:hypothetical protein ACS0TY_034074 [Phlomoides rotata]
MEVISREGIATGNFAANELCTCKIEPFDKYFCWIKRCKHFYFIHVTLTLRIQLRKEGRRNEYERHKLQALNQRQKMVLQRKTEEAAMATKRLKELLEARKSSGRENSGRYFCWLTYYFIITISFLHLPFSFLSPSY